MLRFARKRGKHRRTVQNTFDCYFRSGVIFFI
jgi:hypothetical protein